MPWSSLWVATLIAAFATQTPTTAPADDPVARGVEILLSMQSGDDRAEWPYEGVYRVSGVIPIGYRVGGTSIVAQSLIQTPGYADDPKRVEAVTRACRFVCASRNHASMNPVYAGGYDVRGWGYCTALRFLVRLHVDGRVPPDLAEEVRASITFYLSALQAIEIPQLGGWAYARGRQLSQPSPPATFMTALCVLALYEAKAGGFAVDDGVVERALDMLERSHTASGAIVYSNAGDSTGSREPVPGAVGRMLSAETVLLLADRSTPANVRGALDAFFVHWEWLEKRRKQQGTHVPPYQIAPYYFYFAHGWAADAIELLPMHERPEYRHRLRETIMKTRDADGGWNDRVFERSEAYGTAVVISALQAPDRPSLPQWRRSAAPEKPKDHPAAPAISNAGPSSRP